MRIYLTIGFKYRVIKTLYNPPDAVQSSLQSQSWTCLGSNNNPYSTHLSILSIFDLKAWIEEGIHYPSPYTVHRVHLHDVSLADR